MMPMIWVTGVSLLASVWTTSSSGVAGWTIDQKDVGPADLPPSSPTDYHLVWFDDFDGEALDRRKWWPLIDCSERGNNELQCYTSREKNVRVRNGQLELIAAAEDFEGRNFTSGRVHAAGPGWTYGWFEARARLSKGMHLWPAVWLVPTDRVDGPWPQSGEIDMMEARGQNAAQIESTIHYGSSRTDRGKIGSAMIDFPFDFSQDFHIFGFEWTNQSMRWFLDGALYFETSTDRFFTDKKGERIYGKKGSPFDQNFKWVLNVAVGGFYFPASVYGRISRSDALMWPKPSMEVDWVRVFQRKPDVNNQTSINTEKGSSVSTLVPTSTTPLPLPTATPFASTVSPASANLSATEAAVTIATKEPMGTPLPTTTVAPMTTTTADSVVSVFTSPEGGLTTGVSDEDKAGETAAGADKKESDRHESHKRQESDKTETEILNEKKMNEVVESEADAGSDHDYDIISPMDRKGSPLTSDYYDYY